MCHACDLDKAEMKKEYEKAKVVTDALREAYYKAKDISDALAPETFILDLIKEGSKIQAIFHYRNKRLGNQGSISLAKKHVEALMAMIKKTA